MNIKYTDLLKDKKTPTSNPLTLPFSNGFAPPQYVALTADGSVGGEGKLPTTKPGLPPIPKTEPSGKDEGGKDEGGETIVETQPMSYEEYILSLKSKADDTYKRSIINAQNTYDHSRSAYGENAAALGNMGLTGSGYSQYLDSKAYAQRSADMNAAGAVRADAYANADAQYMDYLNQKETAGKNAYMSIYEALTKDATTYSSADIDRLGAQMGLTPEQISGLKDVRGEQVVKYLDNNDYSKETLDQLFPEGGDLYQNYLNKLITSGTDAVSSNMFDDIDKETATTTYQNIKSLIESQIANTAEGSDERADLKKTLETLSNAYNNTYTNPITVSSTIKFNRDLITSGATSGDRFTLKGDDGKYVVEFTGEAVPEEVIEAANNNPKITDGTVFKYGNDYYVRRGANYYKFRQRGQRSDVWKSFETEFNKKPTSED